MSFQLRSNGGPGVQTDVVDPRSPAQPAALGVTWLLGEFQSGPDNVPAVLSSPADAKIVTGVPVDELEASMCLLDLYREAEPIVVASRITREGASGFWRLFGRDPDRSFRHIYGTNGPTEYIVDAGSTGRWSGCSLFWYVSFASGAALTAAATQSTLNLTGRTPMFTIYERTLTGAVHRRRQRWAVHRAELQRQHGQDLHLRRVQPGSDCRRRGDHRPRVRG